MEGLTLCSIPNLADCARGFQPSRECSHGALLRRQLGRLGVHTNQGLLESGLAIWGTYSLLWGLPLLDECPGTGTRGRNGLVAVPQTALPGVAFFSRTTPVYLGHGAESTPYMRHGPEASTEPRANGFHLPSTTICICISISFAQRLLPWLPSDAYLCVAAAAAAAAAATAAPRGSMSALGSALLELAYRSRSKQTERQMSDKDLLDCTYGLHALRVLLCPMSSPSSNSVPLAQRQCASPLSMPSPVPSSFAATGSWAGVRKPGQAKCRCSTCCLEKMLKVAGRVAQLDLAPILMRQRVRQSIKSSAVRRAYYRTGTKRPFQSGTAQASDARLAAYRPAGSAPFGAYTVFGGPGAKLQDPARHGAGMPTASAHASASTPRAGLTPLHPANWQKSYLAWFCRQSWQQHALELVRSAMDVYLQSHPSGWAARPLRHAPGPTGNWTIISTFAGCTMALRSYKPSSGPC
ncbi:hypothetical protein TARUN_10395 [Trichoderma arundinaceum]|uniref:Uncharacterized protein n=1 Tax=Trichoderma arundinaceum TaxID=490622 RepID=A0A395N6W5_TRIAR|nr:hypothetical protein TARUN_10395 [Trichoderma arundinaceum]